MSVLHRAFAEPEKHGRTPEQVANLERWLPEGMAFRSESESPAAIGAGADAA